MKVIFDYIEGKSYDLDGDDFYFNYSMKDNDGQTRLVFDVYSPDLYLEASEQGCPRITADSGYYDGYVEIIEQRAIEYDKEAELYLYADLEDLSEDEKRAAKVLAEDDPCDRDALATLEEYISYSLYL